MQRASLLVTSFLRNSEMANIVCVTTVVDLHYASSCDDTKESIFFQSRTFSCSQAVFFTNTTRFELTEPPRHRHMICIRKAKSTWRSSNLNCLAKTLFPVQSVCCIVGFLTRSLCGPQHPSSSLAVAFLERGHPPF